MMATKKSKKPAKAKYKNVRVKVKAHVNQGHEVHEYYQMKRKLV